eukprot:CAMPEP_0117655578 /NCGR_PEP_ID=MMETSP0804-20121206/4352_1 /TAXON_ID=1074897 /ORGANISM="Tetraselmis astigmatica, Strain CCMP880" /LENGTH=167 /DNA_ID=CAMNT_0005461935 /DNA_START=321 /DNA_END=827 /DNA_ORIENTATION=+
MSTSARALTSKLVQTSPSRGELLLPHVSAYITSATPGVAPPTRVAYAAPNDKATGEHSDLQGCSDTMSSAVSSYMLRWATRPAPYDSMSTACRSNRRSVLNGATAGVSTITLPSNLATGSSPAASQSPGLDSTRAVAERISRGLSGERATPCSIPRSRGLRPFSAWW